MPTQINGSTGVSKVQDGVVTQADLASNVAGNGPAFRGYVTTAAIPNASVITPTLLEGFDTANAFTPDGAKFQPTIAGYYQFNAFTNFSALPSNGYACIRNNGTRIVGGCQGNLWQAQATALVYLNGTTDYVDLVLFQSSGGAITADIEFTGFLARAA